MRSEESSTLKDKEILHHVLTVEDPKGFRNFLLHSVNYTLGRSLNNSIVLRSNLVSRHHATLIPMSHQSQESYFFRILDGNIEGLRSTNGILVNGKKRFSHILSHGDEILLSKDTKAIYQVIKTIVNPSTNKKNPSQIASFNNPTQRQYPARRGDIVRFSVLQTISEMEIAILDETINRSLETSYQPTIEITPEGELTYLNPAATSSFPNLQEVSTNHPLLQELLIQIQVLQNPVGRFFVREVEVNDRFFEEIIDLRQLPKLIRIYISDITQQRQAEAIISHQIYHDSLTGLPNRNYLHRYLVGFVQSLDNKNTKFAILFLDIDRFKLINDSLGHHIGDLLIKAVGDRIKSLLPPENLLVRWGGDEFAIVAKDISSMDSVVYLAERMIQSLTAPFQCGGHDLHITTSIGASMYPNHNAEVEGLIHNADMAMYHAKLEGRNSFQFYVPNMQEQSFQKLLMENNLRRAIENQEFNAYYQPQVDLVTGKIVGLEVLLRWKHVAFGSVSPAKFIPLAEETGLIIEIGTWVLRQSCLQAIAWQKIGIPPIQISVNLSIKQLQQKDFLDSLKQILEETGFNPHYLELEITEGIMMDRVEEKIIMLNQFRQMGIQLSLDDFGTGYSALSYLRKLPINTLKIDRAFVEYINYNQHDATIVESLINLSHSLNLIVIAEGVETQEQVNLLRRLNCDRIQGHFFYQAMPADEVEALLRAQGATQPS